MKNYIILFLLSLLIFSCKKNSSTNNLTLDELLDMELELFEGEFDGQLYSRLLGQRAYDVKLEINFDSDGTFEAQSLNRFPTPPIVYTETGTYSYNEDDEIIDWNRVDTLSFANPQDPSETVVGYNVYADWELIERNDSLLIFQKFHPESLDFAEAENKIIYKIIE